MEVKTTDQSHGQVGDVRLIYEFSERFKELKGFEKRHRVPQSVSAGDMQFVAAVAEPQLHEDLDKVFSELRSAFSLKRRGISVSGPADGSGIIETPFFNYEISISQMESDPSRVVWRRSITDIRQPENVFDERFEEVFGSQFSILEVATAEPLDLETIVDHVEDAELESVKIDYDKELTWCEIQVAGSVAAVRIHANSIRVSSRRDVSPRELLEAFVDVQQQFLESLSCSGSPFFVDTPVE